MSDFRSPAYIICALRTPVGKYGGALKSVRPDDLSAIVLRGLSERVRMIWAGDAQCVIAGGVESMSRAPYVIPKNSRLI